jgi:aminoglycoside phosphotransferase (APT) family kinase protein
VVADAVPASMAHHPDVVRRVDLALIDAAADLHSVDPREAGLTELGRPEGFGDRQVRGWADRWRRAAPPDAPPTMTEVADELGRTVPTPPRASIVHNDLKLDNCQFHADDPDTVTSVFDWDMATLGDPLFDLGLLLVSQQSTALWALTTDEAVARYASRSGIDVGRIDWYVAFATWRMAVVLQQLYNRYLAGDSADDRLGALGATIPTIAEKAATLLSR